MLYLCSGYSRLVCGECPDGKKHTDKDECGGAGYCSVVQDNVKCEPVEEGGDE